MYPKVFVSEAFLELFDAALNATSQVNFLLADSTTLDKQESLRRIFNLFLSGNIYTDVKDKSVRKYINPNQGSYSGIKDVVFHRLIKENAFENSRSLFTGKQLEDCNSPHFCYFYDKPLDKSKEDAETLGRIFVGQDFLESSFFLHQTFPIESTNESMFQARKIKHPCTSLVVIDKYLFFDAPGRPPKMPNIIDLFNQLIPSNLSSKFQLDIFIENPENNDSVQARFRQIMDAFGSKVSLHVYAPMELKQESDRYFITNYSIISVLHPGDRETSVSCNFYPSTISKDATLEGYKLWHKKLAVANNLRKDTPTHYGLLKAQWFSDDANHEIFNVCEDS